MDHEKKGFIFWVGVIECIIAIVLLIAGVFFVDTSVENDYSGSAQSFSFIMFFLLLWESVLLGVSGFMTMKTNGSWGLSIAGNMIVLFGDLFWTSEAGLFIACLIIGSVIGMIGLAQGLGTSLDK